MTSVPSPTALIGSDVADAALERLLRAAGADAIDTSASAEWSADAGVSECVVADVNVIRRAIHELYSVQDDVTDALVASEDRLLALRALTQVNVTSLGEEESIADLLGEARDLTSSGWVIMVDGTQVHHSDAGTEGAHVPAEILAEVADTGEGSELRLAQGGLAVIAPLREEGRHRILVFVRPTGPLYSTGDLRLVRAASSAIAMRFTLTRLHLSAIARATVEREHEVASSLAQAVFSVAAPTLDGVEVFSTTRPAGLAGGDFFAFAVVGDALWFTVGDVAGKGLPAAMVMTRAVSAARVAFLTHAPQDPAGAMSAMGDELYEYLDDVELFVTVVLGSYQPSSGSLFVCNAGHSPVVLVQNGARSLISASVPPLGVLESPTMRTEAHTLGLGDTLLLGSDGLAEQEDPTGAMIGYDRFLDLCSDLPGASAEELGRHILNAVDEFAQGTPPSDDRTLVIVRPVGALS